MVWPASVEFTMSSAVMLPTVMLALAAVSTTYAWFVLPVALLPAASVAATLAVTLLAVTSMLPGTLML